jgi:hypothetical protein
MTALLLWLLMTAPAAGDAVASKPVGGSFSTARTLPVLEKCLYDELADLGEATFMRSPGETILMIRNGQGPPLLVDIAPPTVQITTRASVDVQNRVKRCA